MKRIPLLFFLVLAARPLHGLSDHFGQSYLFVRPAYHNLAMQQAGWHTVAYYNDQNIMGTLQVIGFHQRSRCDDDLGRYFLCPDDCPRCTDPCKPCCEVPDDDCCFSRTMQRVAGDAIADQKERDIRAEWLGLPAEFDGTFGLNPFSEQDGFYLEYHQNLKRFHRRFFSFIFLSFSTAWHRVRNNPGLLQQTIATTPNDDGSTTIDQAFNQQDWIWSKIDGCRSCSGVGEFKIKLGATLYAKDGCEVNYYTGLGIPTNDKPNPEFILNPVIGNGRHVALYNAALFNVPLTREGSWLRGSWFFNIEHHYLFKNDQCRTIGLKGKCLSRYLQFTRCDAAADTPAIAGVNLLTQCVTVRPESFVDLSTGFRMYDNGFELEIGYDLWAHGDECLDLICPWEPVYGIRGSDSTKSSHESDISFLALDDEEFTPVRFCDLDLLAGASREAITHRVHLALGKTFYGHAVDVVFNAGAFYEVPQNNTAFKQWGIWGKVAVAI